MHLKLVIPTTKVKDFMKINQYHSHVKSKYETNIMCCFYREKSHKSVFHSK